MKNRGTGAARLRKRRSLPVRLGFLGYVWLLLLALLMPAWATPTIAATAAPNVTGEAAIAVDATTGQITYAKNIHKRLPMASTTKIMTALTALAIPGTNLTERYTVTQDDMAGPGETSMNLRVGETPTFSDLLYGMLLNSGNDAALAIARYAGAKLQGDGTPLERFIARMNTQAAALGLRNSHYVNPHGLDSKDHYSSAYDLAITGWYALHNPTISQIVKLQKATVPGHQLSNLNTFLKTYNGATGIKTGFDDGAGLCMVASATRNGQTGIAVVLHTDSPGFTGDPTAMLNYTFDLLNQPGGLKNQPPAGSGPLDTNAQPQFIGYPKGDALLPANNPSTGSDGNGQAPIDVGGSASNVNGYLIGGPGVAAQINTTPPAQITPITGGDEDNSGSTNTSTDKKGGGPNFLVIIIVLLIIGSVAFGLGRMGYLGGDTGRNAALRFEDMAIVALQSGRKGIGRLFTSLKPGNHGDEPSLPVRERPAPEVSKPVASSPNFRERVSPPRHEESAPTIGTAQNPARPRTNPGTTNRKNPLDGMFDDVQPFGWDDNAGTNNKPAPTVEPGPIIKPPQPMSPLPNPATPANRTQPTPGSEKERPVVNPKPPAHTNRTAAEPQQKPDLNSPIDRFRPPQPLSPRPAPPSTPSPARNEKPENVGERNYFSGQVFGAGGVEGLMARARQAIDYAYAGRLQASTDEFRKVVEQDPLFDFGGLEEFDQMPVLGYKALANAYSASGRHKFALLLLELGIEKYPNDLELRNMLRTFKREIGQ